MTKLFKKLIILSIVTALALSLSGFAWIDEFEFCEIPYEPVNTRTYETPTTEEQVRQVVVDAAMDWVGLKEKDGSFKEIIDLYNSYRPLPRTYKVKYTDEWCSTFASAVAIKVGMTDIIPVECGCELHVRLFKALDSWVEDDDYIPSPGDFVFYCWEAEEEGDCKQSADHVGIVVEVDAENGMMKVVDGNTNNQVAYRNSRINGWKIRGYGVPKYEYYIHANTAEETEPAVCDRGDENENEEVYSYDTGHSDRPYTGILWPGKAPAHN